MDSTELLMKFTAIDEISKVLDGIGSKIEQFVGQLSSMGGAAGKAFGIVGEAALAAGTAVAGIAIGVFAAADKMAVATAQYSVQVERNSFLLNGNTTLLQTLYRAGDILGQGIDQINVRLTFFNKTLEGGAPTLKKFGLTLDELGISTTNADQALLQLADTFHKSNDEGLKTAATTALFGRNAAGMIPFLNLGSEGIGRLTQEFKDFGLVLTDGQLQVSALAGVMHDRLGLVIKGIETQVGVNLEIAFMVLWDVMSKVLTGGSGLIQAFAGWVAKAVIWVAAFIAALTGTTISVEDFTKALDDSSTMLSLNSGAAQDAGNNMDQLGAATKDSTTALQDQVQALQDQKKSFDDAMQAETDAINLQKSAYDDLHDAEVASINEQIRQLDLANQMAAAQGNVADIQSKIAADQAAIARAPFLGITDTSALYKQLEADQDALAKATTQIAFDANKNQLEDKLRQLEAEKKAGDSAFQDKIKAIQDVTKATNDSYDDQIRAVQEHIKQVERANAANVASTKAAMSSNLGNTAGFTQGATNMIASLKAAFASSFAEMSGAGSTMAGDLMDAIAGTRIYSGGGTFYRKGGLVGAIADLNQAVKDIGKAFDSLHTNVDLQTLTGANPMPLTAGHRMMIFEEGGWVPGVKGAPQMAVVHGGEFVVSNDMLAGRTTVPAAASAIGSDESVAILRQILWALTRSGGSSTGVEALVNKLVEQAAYARSRGTMTYAAG